jgi:hypothetical protein
MKALCSTCRKEITGAVFLLADQPTRSWCGEICRNEQIIPFHNKEKEIV